MANKHEFLPLGITFLTSMLSFYHYLIVLQAQVIKQHNESILKFLLTYVIT